MSSISRISTSVDFDKDGKRVSFLAAPKSTNESAYGTVTIPIAVIKNGTGPTLFLSGGVHGDEYEGPVALMKLVRDLDPDQVQGRLIVVPCLNLPAVIAGERCSPIDGLNLNRVFPGEREGTITPMIAHFVSTVLLPMVDVQVDFHSGGKTLEYLPSINMNACEDRARQRKTFEALEAFGAPIGLLDRNLDDSGLLSGVFEAAGILNLNTELGGAGIVSKQIVRIAETGIRNLLKHFGLMEGEIVTPEQQGRAPTRLAQVSDLDCYVMAPDDGLYEPFVELGDDIEAGQPIGQVHYPHHLEKAPWVTYSERSGFLLCKRPAGRVERGDNVAIIAQDLDSAAVSW